MDDSKHWKKIKKKLSDEGNESVTNCPQVEMRTFTGKKRMTLAADLHGILRIIQVGYNLYPC